MTVTGKPRDLDASLVQRLQEAADSADRAEDEMKAAVIAASKAGGSVRVIAAAGRLSKTTVQKWVSGQE